MVKASIIFELRYDLDTDEGYTDDIGIVVYNPYDMLKMDLKSIEDTGAFTFIDSILLMDSASLKPISYTILPEEDEIQCH